MPATRIYPSEITPESLYQKRRQLILGGAAFALAGSAIAASNSPQRGEKIPNILTSFTPPADKITAYDSVTTYGNFYEFGPDKDSPGKNAGKLRTRPWSISIEGEVKTPKTFALEEVLKWTALEERVYRLRCVEGWSAVVPWVGFPFRELLKHVELTGNAKYVEFWSLADPDQMPYVRLPLLDWPYVEALRLDEAMHPLTLLSVGMYGEVMPKQNGAPIRLVVPWKYGFKSAKSLVKIRFVEKQPKTAWMKAGPNEYGFYSNVNPDVAHPRWSQSTERRLGEFLKRPTLPFNGYAEQVASLYAGMDLRKNF